MIPELKAKELVEKFRANFESTGHNVPDGDGYINEKATTDSAKQCAILCCDEIINLCAFGLSETAYWQQVKEHITKM